MAISSFVLVAFSILSLLIPYTTQLQSSQSWSLLRLQRLLDYPPILTPWNNYTDFCSGDTNSSLTVVCYGDSITQLHINGNSSFIPLSHNFSIDSFFTTLAALPNLTVLSLTSLGLWGTLPDKISRLPELEILNMSSNFLFGSLPKELTSLKSLQTLILNDNLFTGSIPGWVGQLPTLSVLSLRNNSFIGRLPDELSGMKTLRVLALSANSLSGEVPDLGGLSNLQALDLGGNFLGPEFPRLGKKLVTLILRRNRFTGGLPDELSSLSQLQEMDISSNRFVGPFPPVLLALPSIRRLDISGNRFTGMLFRNMSCGPGLEFADLSLNLLTGSLPECLVLNSVGKSVLYSGNCLDTGDRSQHPSLFCENQALAVGLPHKKRKASVGKGVVVASSVVGVVGGALFVGFLVVFALQRARANATWAKKKPPRRLVEYACTGYPSKLLADARYISQTMKLAALGVPTYRSFSLEEIEAATNNFELSSIIGEGSHGQMYRGRLNDGSLVVIKCLKLKKNHTSQIINRYIELISKLRHGHLVSALGHCFEYYLEDSTVSRLFLIFEYVVNGTLRSNISEGDVANKLTWTQRIAAAIGVAKGIQFLHAGIVPGLVANDLKITNVYLDQNLVAKIGSYNLPVLKNMKAELAGGGSLSGPKDIERTKNGDKMDIYDFGVILLEIISGRPVTFQGEVGSIKNQVQATVAADGPAKSSLDQALRRTCCGESLRTVVQICFRCLSKEPSERPSVEDVLWNLQFAAQVQDAWRGDSQSSEGSSFLPSPTIAQPD